MDKQTGEAFVAVSSAEPDTVPADSESATAWTAFCRDLERAGHAVLAQPGTDAPPMQAETLRYLIRELRAGLEWFTEAELYDQPRFIHVDDSGSGPPGPNLDNTYLYAHVRPGRRYVVRIDTTTIFDLIIGVSDVDYRNFGDYSLDDFTVDDDGVLEVVVAPSREGANWIELPTAAYRLAIRIYYRDWATERLGDVTIDRLDRDASAPAVPAVADMSDALAKTTEYVRTWPFKYPIFQTVYADEIEPNTMRGPVPLPGGGEEIKYGLSRYRLDDDEALLIETEVPDARYWGFHVYTMPWFSAIDPGHRVTSLNCAQAHVDEDGRVRIVVSHRDPGVQNWLDTGGFPTGAVFYRWIWTNDAPVPRARVVPVSDVRNLIPSGTPEFGPAERREQLSVRRLHLQRRNRA
ncbi:DUF1214 domain-containing protein [[Mycobacterium] vasticus]|uniref:DUF1214 domain-containing protein n=1 Tax=[Mycobacterium] vasticus TaxID=2875777 RepID=A0ABU5Z3F6_9MYCO|nr:DUF1214 domain-containing protein [Mycolicibacter sp. MYC017]MEB3071675.1 DUF1214 domain-containing protein [Mycolicibacter sp. MYC017]